MKKLILSLVFVINSCNFVLSDSLTGEDAEEACLLVNNFYDKIFREKKVPEDLFSRFKKECENSGLWDKCDLEFRLNDRHTTLKKELGTLLRFQGPLKLLQSGENKKFMEAVFEANDPVSLIQPLLESKSSPQYNIIGLLVFAASKNKQDIVEFLLGFLSKRNIDINSRDRLGRLPLITMVAQGNLDMVKFLCDNGAKIDNQNPLDGCTPLIMAAQEGKLDIVKYLVEHGADVDLPTRNNCTPLIVATNKGYLGIVEYLVEHSADVNKCNQEENTPLILAAQFGCLGIVEILVKHNADVNKQNATGNTPLILAVKNNYLEVVQYLLKNKADPNLCNKKEHTPLIFAVQNKRLDIVKCLVENNADVNRQVSKICTPLFLAAQEGCLDIVEYLVEQGAEVDWAGMNGNTPLLMAVTNGHLEVVKCLVEHDANVNKSDQAGCTPLFIATQDKSDDIFKYLLALKNIEINAQNCLGVTPFMKAVEKGYKDKVICLAKKGANVNLPNKEGGVTPLIMAIESERLDIAEYLLTLENIELDASGPLTPLLVAIYFNRVDIVKLLIEKNVTISGVNLTLAVSYGRKEIINLLIEKGGCALIEKTLLIWNPNINQESILLLIKAGMAIKNILPDLLNTGIIEVYLEKMGCPVPESPSDMRQQNEFLEKAKNFFRMHFSSLPEEHSKAILDYCKKKLWRKNGRELNTFVQDLKSKNSPAPSPNFSEVTAEVDSVLSAGLKTDNGNNGTPTQTQKRKMQRANASANRAAKGPNEPPSKEKKTRGTPKEESFEIIFNFTPRERSKRLDFSTIEGFIGEIRNCCRILTDLGATFTITGEDEYRLKCECTLPDWAQEFFDAHKKTNSIAFPHGSNKTCTDHLDKMASYLINYMCLAVQKYNERTLPAEKRPAIDACRNKLKEFLEAGQLDTGIIKGLYPNVLATL